MKEITVLVPTSERRAILPVQVLDLQLASAPLRLYLAVYRMEPGALEHDESFHEQGKALGELLSGPACKAFLDGLSEALGAIEAAS